MAGRRRTVRANRGDPRFGQTGNGGLRGVDLIQREPSGLWLHPVQKVAEPLLTLRIGDDRREVEHAAGPPLLPGIRDHLDAVGEEVVECRAPVLALGGRDGDA